MCFPVKFVKKIEFVENAYYWFVVHTYIFLPQPITSPCQPPHFENAIETIYLFIADKMSYMRKSIDLFSKNKLNLFPFVFI